MEVGPSESIFQVLLKNLFVKEEQHEIGEKTSEKRGPIYHEKTRRESLVRHFQKHRANYKPLMKKGKDQKNADRRKKPNRQEDCTYL